MKDGAVGAPVGGAPARILGSETAAPGRVEHRMSERITVEISDGIADVRLNRGDKMNAMDGPMFKALIETADELAKTRGCGPLCFRQWPGLVRRPRLSGFQSMAGGGESNTSSIGEMENDRITHNAQQAVWGWRELPVPVIAAVHGVAFGAGIQLAAGCDIRFVAPDVRMSILEIRWGISPDMTITHLLPGLIGADVAKELIWTGREVNGEEAVRIGLATHVSEDSSPMPWTCPHDRWEEPACHPCREAPRRTRLRRGFRIRVRTGTRGDLQPDRHAQPGRVGHGLLREAHTELHRGRGRAVKVLVTGATGFLGSHTVRALRRRTRRPSDGANADEATALFERMHIDGCEIVTGDITDRSSVEAAVDGCEAVVHAAAVVAIEPTREAEMHATNLAGPRTCSAQQSTPGVIRSCTSRPLRHCSRSRPTGHRRAPGRRRRERLWPDQSGVRTVRPLVAGRRPPGRDDLPIRHRRPEDWNESINLNSVKLWIEKGFPVAKGYSGSCRRRDLADVIASRSARTGSAGCCAWARTSLLAAGRHDERGDRRRFASMPLPKPVWWVWSRLGDLAARVGIDLVLTSDGYDYIFHSKPGDDSATIERTGVTFRPIVDTWRDMFTWMLEQEMVPAKRLGTLAD